MEYVREAFGWKIYRVEGLVAPYFIGIRDTYEPVEGSSIGDLLEKIADATESM